MVLPELILKGLVRADDTKREGCIWEGTESTSDKTACEHEQT